MGEVLSFEVNIRNFALIGLFHEPSYGKDWVGWHGCSSKTANSFVQRIEEVLMAVVYSTRFDVFLVHFQSFCKHFGRIGFAYVMNEPPLLYNILILKGFWTLFLVVARKRRGCLAQVGRYKSVLASYQENRCSDFHSLWNPHYSARLTFQSIELRISPEFVADLKNDSGKCFSP